MPNLNKSLTKYNKTLEKTKPTYSGKLGIKIDGQERVEHATRNSFVYVRIGDNLSEVVQAFNDKVSPVYDLPVVIQRVRNRWLIIGRDTERYSDWGTSAPFLPKHADQHSFNRDGGGGGDAVAIYPDQFMPLLVYPSGTFGAGMLMVAPYLLQRDADFIYVGNTGTGNLLIYKPIDNQAIMGLVYLDTDTGNPGILIASGTPFAGSITGTNAITPYLPYPSDTQEPLYGFRLVSGTSSLTWDNLYNVRQLVGGGQGGGTIVSGTYVLGSQTENRVLVTSNAPGLVITDDNIQWHEDYGQLRIGQPNVDVTPNSIFQAGTDTTAPQNILQAFSDTNVSGILQGWRSRGTKASPTGVETGDYLLRLRGRAYDNTPVIESGSSVAMYFLADSTHTPTDRATRIEFWATPAASVTNTLALTIYGGGAATLAGALTLPASGLIMNAGTFNLTGGGTLALGGFTLTMPKSDTVATLTSANVFTTQQQITVPTTTSHGLIIKTSDDNATKDLLQFQSSAGAITTLINEAGQVHIGGDLSGYETYGLTVKGSLGGIHLRRTGTNPPFIILSTDTANSGGQVRGVNAGGIDITNSGATQTWFQFASLRQLAFAFATVTTTPVEAYRITTRISTAATGGGTGFGTGIGLYAETATDGTDQQQAQIMGSWIDATNASRKAKLSLSAYDTAARLGMEIEASGSAAMLAFYGGTTVIRGAALTTQLTSLTHTAPGTPDYAIQDLVDSGAGSAFGFATKDEGNTVLSVILNLQTRVAELEARLGSATGVNLFA